MVVDAAVKVQVSVCYKRPFHNMHKCLSVSELIQTTQACY